MNARTSWILAAAALALFAAGLWMSSRVEPGVEVEAVTLAGVTPALRFLPAGAGPHPVALAAHGVTASKETLFRLCEALAAAGFACYAVDLPGHGESRLGFGADGARAIGEVSRALGGVDVFVGHSLGAYTGARSVRGGGLTPRLFIALGALPDLGEPGPPLLLLAGRFEEAVSPARLLARAGARVVVSPWSDHALEPYDPHLIGEAVEAASAAVGQAAPAAPGRWRWRLTGALLGLLGALGLGDRLPTLFPRLARARGPLIAAIVLGAVALLFGTWLGVAPIPRRVPLQLAVTAVSGLVLVGAARLRVPRWVFAACAALAATGCAALGYPFLALFAALGALVLFAGTAVGWVATRGGTRWDGDIALAMFVGYAIGQWVPMGF